MTRARVAWSIAAGLLAAGCASLPKQCGEGPAWPAGDTSREVAQLKEALAKRLARHLSFERNIANAPQALLDTQRHITRELRQMGLEPKLLRVPIPGSDLELGNVEAVIRGRESNDHLLVGAHFDTARGTPGANDNGTGVAALLEIASMLAREPKQRRRTVRIVFFVNEEEPFFEEGDSAVARAMGSRHYVAHHAAGVGAMLSLETLGYYTTRKDSQCLFAWPESLTRTDSGPAWSLAWDGGLPSVDCALPGSLLGSAVSTGDFVAFVSSDRAGDWVRRARGAFCARNPGVNAAAIVMPSAVPGTLWSDHKNFLRGGIPALMVTDTAPNRYPYYHSPLDRASALGGETLEAYARVVMGLRLAIEALLDE